jgi:hypothetical protein
VFAWIDSDGTLICMILIRVCVCIILTSFVFFSGHFFFPRYSLSFLRLLSLLQVSGLDGTCRGVMKSEPNAQYLEPCTQYFHAFIVLLLFNLFIYLFIYLIIYSFILFYLFFCTFRVIFLYCSVVLIHSCIGLSLTM